MKTTNPNNPNRLKILALALENPQITLRELSERTGLAITSVRYHMIRLDRAGVIRRNTKRGNHNHKPHKTLSDYGRQGRGKSAFVPRKTRRTDKLQQRIEMVVKKALKRQGRTDYDVIRHVNAPLRFTNAHKIG